MCNGAQIRINVKRVAQLSEDDCDKLDQLSDSQIKLFYESIEGTDYPYTWQRLFMGIERGDIGADFNLLPLAHWVANCSGKYLRLSGFGAHTDYCHYDNLLLTRKGREQAIELGIVFRITDWSQWDRQEELRSELRKAKQFNFRINKASRYCFPDNPDDEAPDNPYDESDDEAVEQDIEYENALYDFYTKYSHELSGAHSSEKDHPFRRKVITCSDEKDHLLNRSEATRVIQIVL